MYLLSYNGLSFVSRAIQVVTWGGSSHSALANNDGWVQEVWEGCGYSLAAHPWENHTKGTPIDVYEIEGANDAVWKAGLAEQGSNYEMASLLGFLPGLRHFWRDKPHAWFCSQFVAHCCRVGKAPLFNQQTPLYKLTPTMLTYSPRVKWVAEVTDEKAWDELINPQG